MADVLHCDCTIKSIQEPSYWWQLILEVLETHNLRFNSPYCSDGTSNYYYSRYLPPYTEATAESESVFGTLQDVVAEISARSGSVISTFWSQEDDGEYIDYDVLSGLERNAQLALGFSLAGGYIRDAPYEKAQTRLRQFFSCCRDLFETCQPDSGAIYWENSGGHYAPWAIVGTSIEDFLQKKHHGDIAAGSDPIIHDTLQVIEQYHFTNKKTLFFLNPAPILRRHGKGKYWDYMPVL
ncbi:MAG TPA: hypothetical protein VL461_00100 [Dictyobacter sp.]|nr:hypothetical protein [Dictyobacter sp.]